MIENRLKEDLDFILQQAQNEWKELRHARIFITGGTGFVGTWLLEAMLWANRHYDLQLMVTALSRTPDAFYLKAPHLAKDSALTLLQGDVKDFAYPEGIYDYVILGATESSATLNQNNPTEMIDTIVQGTRHTLVFAKKAKAKKILFLSSGAVYGKQPPELTHVSEAYLGAPAIYQPGAAYAIGKYVGEHLCVLHGHEYQLPIVIARLFAFVGPYLPLDRHFAIGNFIRDGLEGGEIVIQGDGSPYRSYLYASDMVVGLLRVLFRCGLFTRYSIGTGEAVSIAEIAHEVAKQFTPSPNVKVMKPPQTALPERYVPCMKQSRATLDFSPSVSLQEAIAKTIIWYRNTIL